MNIALLWHSANSANLGLGALTAGHMAIVRSVAEAADPETGERTAFEIVGSADRGPSYIPGPGVNVVGIRTKDLVSPVGSLVRAVRRCRLVCDIGGGDSFADLYGNHRFMFLTVSKLVVLLTGRPLILSPQTIGPFQRRWTRWVATWLMNRARAVVARDAQSFQYLKDLGVKSPIFEATDVAFRLPYTPPPLRSADGPIRVGVNVSGLLFNGGYTRSNMFGLAMDYAALMRELITALVGRDGCEVHLVGHVLSDQSDVEDDYRVALRLAEEFPDVVVAPRFSGPSEAKSYIAGLDFFCGSRMHACIAAFSSGVPVVPIAYSRKFTGLFGSLEYPFTADCRSESSAAIIEKVLRGLDDRDSLRHRVQAGIAIADRKLAIYEDVLRDCLAQAEPKPR